MVTIFGALAPVFLLVALGHVLRRRAFPSPSFFVDAERFVYWLLLPALLFITTSGFAYESFEILPVATALVAGVLATAGAALLLRSRLQLSDPEFSSLFQGAVRTNSYVGLAGGAALHGEAGLAIMGLVVFVVITSVNLVSVAGLVRFGQWPDKRPGLLGAFVRNPLIVACILGFLTNATGLDLPPVLREALEICARAALPLGLICVGAGLELIAMAENRPAVLATCGLKLIFMPVATALFCRLLGVEGLTADAAILFSAVPISASSYVLARTMGGDARLMAALITWTTLAGAVTIPLMLSLLT